MGLCDCFVMMAVFPGGLIYGFYLCKIILNSPKEQYEFNFPLLISPICSLLISLGIAVKKRLQQKYTFDSLYLNSIACSFYIVSGLFFLRKSRDIALYFGFTGNGIAYISSLFHVGFRAATTRDRYIGIAGLHICYFTGVIVGTALHTYLPALDDVLVKCGQILLGSGILLLGALICNHILNYCNLNNYRTSRDELWSYYNTRKWLYRNRPETLAIYQRADNKFRDTRFIVIRNKETLTVFSIFIVVLTNFSVFCKISLTTAATVSTVYYQSDGILWLMLATVGGIFFSLPLQPILSPRSIYIAVGIVKTSVLICILVFLETNASAQLLVILYLMYFFCLGALYSIAVTMLLEVSNPRNCEITVSLALCVQTSLLYLLMYLDVEDCTRSLFISYIVTSVVSILIIQSLAPIPGSLIEIRNYLLGIRKPAVKINANIISRY